ncbi:BTAD domain-containing putative transcriptional regulator [Pseudonocardia acaciae]|uniref:BTAD domain-containing putative transcriptional regulator n=1 Tax=Pseudonocardia acaciae TaxID=551276 RepID=UPI0014700A9F|nr:BTAD domain-containing putative transcriptional regulator [Pseudonocardia acaciae]
MLFCRVLGPLEVVVDGSVSELGGPAPRRLLAALLAADGKPVADAALAELVWGADAPPVVSGALQVNVSRLRSALGAGGRELLERTGAGYRFRVEPEQTDVGRFAELVAEGGRLFDGGDPAAAVRAYWEALGLWRGEPWAELPEPSVAGVRVRLNELRAVAVEELQAARLAVGDTVGAVAALGEAVTEAPFRERRWELLVLGLYRAGRQGHALAELRRVRELLADELGVDPGPALRTLERRLLNQDPTLLAAPCPEPLPTAPAGPGPAATPVEPRPAPAITRPLSSFIGRHRELELLAGSLARQRLVSLTGPAGVGKTRLAIEYAVTVTDRGPAWLARLADVSTPEAVPPAVAAAIGVAQLAGDPVELIQGALAGTPGLLVLDNCEHLVEPVAELVIALLASCPGLRILTTSRVSLGVDGEYLLPVAPLAVDTETTGDGAAVRLLVDRVRAARPDWTPSAEELASARRICTALDGLPLAIELAASRERAFGLAGLADHLHDRLTVLGAPPRGSLTPHATLRAAIRWSVALLGAQDRAMLLRLWPFEGGFSWPAAEAVQPADAAAQPVLATLASLVDRSVVMADTGATPARYRLLETVRAYCREVDPDPAATAAAHAAWVRGFVADRVALTTGSRAGDAYRALADELPNLRAGIAHDLAHRPVDALRTAAALGRMWVTAGGLPEGARLIRTALEAAPDAEVTDRVDALLSLSTVSFHAGDATEAVGLADRAIELLADGDQDQLLHALMCRAAGLIQLGEAAAAVATAGELVAKAERRAAPAWVRASARLSLGTAQLLQGRRAEGEAAVLAARNANADCGHMWGKGTAELVLAWCLLGDAGRDPAIAGRSARTALEYLNSALDVFTELHNVSDSLGVLYAGAHALPFVDRAADGVRLRAAVVQHARRVGADCRRYIDVARDRVEPRLDAALPPAERAAAERDGRALGWTATVELLR